MGLGKYSYKGPATVEKTLAEAWCRVTIRLGALEHEPVLLHHQFLETAPEFYFYVRSITLVIVRQFLRIEEFGKLVPSRYHPTHSKVTFQSPTM